MYPQDFIVEVATKVRLRDGLNLNMGSTPVMVLKFKRILKNLQHLSLTQSYSKVRIKRTFHEKEGRRLGPVHVLRRYMLIRVVRLSETRAVFMSKYIRENMLQQNSSGSENIKDRNSYSVILDIGKTNVKTERTRTDLHGILRMPLMPCFSLEKHTHCQFWRHTYDPSTLQTKAERTQIGGEFRTHREAVSKKIKQKLTDSEHFVKPHYQTI